MHGPKNKTNYPVIRMLLIHLTNFKDHFTGGRNKYTRVFYVSFLKSFD